MRDFGSICWMLAAFCKVATQHFRMWNGNNIWLNIKEIVRDYIMPGCDPENNIWLNIKEIVWGPYIAVPYTGSRNALPIES